MAYVRGAGDARGTLSPILDVARSPEAPQVRPRVHRMRSAAQQVLEQVAEERGTTSYAVLAGVRERIATARPTGSGPGAMSFAGTLKMGALCVRHTEQTADDLGGANPVGSSDLNDLKARAASRAWSPVRKRNSGAPCGLLERRGTIAAIARAWGRLRRRSAPRARRSRTTHRPGTPRRSF